MGNQVNIRFFTSMLKYLFEEFSLNFKGKKSLSICTILIRYYFMVCSPLCQVREFKVGKVSVDTSFK